MKKKYKVVKNKAHRATAIVLVAALSVGLVSIAASAVSTWWSKVNYEEPEPSTPKSGTQAIMTHEGNWVALEEYGLEFWMPSDAPRDERDYGTHCITNVQRDKGLFPELSYGLIILPDEPDTYDLEGDPMGVANAMRPLYTKVLETVWNGVNGAVNLDMSLESLVTGRQVLKSTGETYCTVVYQNTKPGEENTEPWSQEENQKIFCNFAIVGGRPVMSWATWDLIVYNGEQIAEEISTDIITSVREID